MKDEIAMPVLIGTRRDESAVRERNMEARGESAIAPETPPRLARSRPGCSVPYTGGLGQDDGASKALAIDPSMSQGQRIHVLRKAAGLSYQSLAQAMPEFPDLRLSRIERDGERLAQDQFGRLENYLNEVISGER